MNLAEDAPEVHFETVACCLCASESHHLLYAVDLDAVRLSSMWHDRTRLPIHRPMHIVRCSRCGLVFVNPRVAFDERLAPYDREAETNYFEKTRQVRSLIAHNLVQQISPITTRGGKWLDVGCGDGVLMETAHEHGYDVYGTEISSQLIERLRLKFGEDRILSYDLAQLTPAAFDVVTMISVLEHAHAPFDMLVHVRRSLRPAGILAIEVPNINSPTARVRRASWDQIEPLGHLYYFSDQTLRALLDKAGFRIIGRCLFTGKADLSTGFRPLKRLLATADTYLGPSLALVAAPR